MRGGPNRKRKEAPEGVGTEDPDALIPCENTIK
jgi:hypothetical protein